MEEIAPLSLQMSRAKTAEAGPLAVSSSRVGVEDAHPPALCSSPSPSPSFTHFFVPPPPSLLFLQKQKESSRRLASPCLFLHSLSSSRALSVLRRQRRGAAKQRARAATMLVRRIKKRPPSSIARSIDGREFSLSCVQRELPRSAPRFANLFLSLRQRGTLLDALLSRHRSHLVSLCLFPCSQNGNEKERPSIFFFQCSPEILNPALLSRSLFPLLTKSQTKFETKSNRVKGLSFHPHR